jgi:N utilization substance protein A
VSTSCWVVRLVSRADLEEETVDEVLRILGEEFEEE